MSARPDTWMPMYWGDYARDTGHLNACGHGAYLMLIKHYWCTGQPIADDDNELWRIACCDSKGEWLKLRPKVVRLFVSENGLLRHKRIEHELANAVYLAGQRSAAGRASAEARKRQQEANKEPTGVATGVAVPLQQNARPSPSPSPEGKKESRSLRSLVERDDEFRAFWDLYPRKKEGPGACEKAWAKARKLADVETILDGLRCYEFKPDYLPMASTWLNEKRWLTQPDTPPVRVAPPARQRRQTAGEQWAELLLDQPAEPAFDLEGVAE